MILSDTVIRQFLGVLAFGLPMALISFFCPMAYGGLGQAGKPAVITSLSAFLLAVVSYTFGASLVSESPKDFEEGNSTVFIFLVVAAVTVLVLSIGRSRPRDKQRDE